MAKFSCLFFLRLVFFVVQSDSRDNNIISASVEDDVRLHCSHPKLLESQMCTRVKWTKYSSNGVSSKVILARPETPEFPDVKNIKWDTNNDRQTFLLLSHVQKSDEGVYSCEIWSGWVLIYAKNITLKLKECPSKLKREKSGSPVTLDCSEGKEAGGHNYSWVMLKGGIEVPLPQRFQVNGPTLSIRSALVKDSEWYRCKYRLRHTHRCVDINLLLQETGSSTESTTKVPQKPANIQTVQALRNKSTEGFTAAHAVAVVIGVVVLAALVGAALYWKHNRKAPQEMPEYEDIVEYDVTYDVVADDVVADCPPLGEGCHRST